MLFGYQLAHIQYCRIQIEKERMSLSKMVSQSSDTQQDLERTKHSLQAKLAEIEVLENQQDELNRRLMV